jgi:hypothetical protein
MSEKRAEGVRIRQGASVGQDGHGCDDRDGGRRQKAREVGRLLD